MTGVDLRFVRDGLLQLPASIWLTLLAIGWIGLCLTVAIGVARPQQHVRYFGVPALALVLVASGLISWSANKANPFPAAVVVASEIPVYQGSGEAFPQLPNVEIREGDTVRVIQRRGDWLQIRSATGDQGWTRAELIEQV